MKRARTALTWCVLAIVIAVPIFAASASPLLAWRQPVYILAGFAGIVAMALLLIQPLLIGGYLSAGSPARNRRLHRWVGILLVAAVVIHVAALWVTSPPDVVDALLFTSPTPFSAWGVIAMWAVFAAALLAAFRRLLQLRTLTWRGGHTVLVSVTVIGSVVHAMLIEGTMETVTKSFLCLLVLSVTAKVVFDLRVWAKRNHRSN